MRSLCHAHEALQLEGLDSLRDVFDDGVPDLLREGEALFNRPPAVDLL